MSVLLKKAPWEGIPATGPLMRPETAAEYIGVSTSAVYRMINQGRLPPIAKLGKRASGIPKPWLDAVIADRLTPSTGGRGND